MVELGSGWKRIPLLVRYLMLPSQPHIHICDTCEATWDAREGDDCRWCAKRSQANAAFILKPPAPRGYGYATPEDLAHLGINPELERRTDLEHWRHDLELAVEAGLITQHEGETAWQSANHNQNSTSSTSSTGKTSTTAPSTTKTPSSTTSRSAAAGPPSSHRPKQGNRRSSSDSQWKPQKPGTPSSTSTPKWDDPTSKNE